MVPGVTHDIDGEQWLDAAGEPVQAPPKWPQVPCPKCHALQEDRDGFGVLHCAACGYCSHPSRTGGVCGLCGHVEAPPCASGHEWSNDYGNDWKPDPGTPCDCGARRWQEQPTYTPPPLTVPDADQPEEPGAQLGLF
jgi:hypothetical protein